MALTITNDKEIGLNGLKYNLVNPLLETYLSPSPGKVNIGSDSYSRENYLSQWIQKDRRGGILINEMDEAIHSDRSWWTNCIISYDGHLTLPRLATAITPDDVYSITFVNPTSSTDGASAWSNEANAINGSDGDYAQTTVQVAAQTWSDWLELDIAATNCAQIKFHCSVENNDFLDDGGIQVEVFHDSQWNSVTVGTSWHNTAITDDIVADIQQDTESVTSVRIRLFNNDGVNVAHCRIHFAQFGSSTSSDIIYFANFNGEKYMAKHTGLYKLDSGRASYTILKDDFDAAITAIIPSLNSRLYIFIGDSDNYYWMSTAEAFTQSNSSAATYGVENSGLLYKMSSTGTFASSNDPDGGAPTWNNLADVTTDSAKIESLIRGRDADGNFVVYCATNASIQIYDATNDLWLLTDLRLPDHPNGGKGAAYWNDAHYFSYGLGIKKYVTGNIASISEIGLDREGGIPVEYNGEIVKFSADSQYFLAALVDASQTSGNSQSGLYIFTGIAWECWWVSANNDEVMTDVIVSSAESGYAIYWSVAGVVYYIDLPRGLQNVRQLSGTQKFEASGIFLSPWFDAGTVAYGKLVQAITSYAKSVTTNETITIKYRTNHDNEDRDTGFTTLVALDTAGENGSVETLLASGAGLEFDAIQFRIDFARGSTNTLSPDLLALVTAYMLRTGSTGNRAWNFTVNIAGELDNQNAHQQYDSLWSAIKSGTLIPLVFRNADVAETHYVQLFLNSSQTQVGSHYLGQMALQAVEV